MSRFSTDAAKRFRGNAFTFAIGTGAALLCTWRPWRSVCRTWDPMTIGVCSTRGGGLLLGGGLSLGDGLLLGGGLLLGDGVELRGVECPELR